MNIIERKCIKEYSVFAPSGSIFKIEKGRVYTTSLVGEAMAAHGPGPRKDHVVVFTQYYVSVPEEHFENIEEDV